LEQVYVRLYMPYIDDAGNYQPYIEREGTYQGDTDVNVLLSFEIPFTAMSQIQKIEVVSGGEPVVRKFMNVRLEQLSPGQTSTCSSALVISGKG
jgi:hypothetical protein